MRISKDPEVRKQEIIDTAMKLFAEKGYEATSMRDIAKEMNVVSGLCYRYFKSKEDLYKTALHLYAKECAAPMITLINKDYNSLDECYKELCENFIKTDGKQRYTSFFDNTQNKMFHFQLDVKMSEIIVPHIINQLNRFNNKGLTNIKDTVATAKIIMAGQLPIINDSTLTPEKKCSIIVDFINKLLK